jgi:hypothetical protein
VSIAARPASWQSRYVRNASKATAGRQTVVRRNEPIRDTGSRSRTTRKSPMVSSRRALESLPPCPWQQPAHHHLIRIAPTARKLVALHCLCSKVGCLLVSLSLFAWKRHPLANDCPAYRLFGHLSFTSSSDLGFSMQQRNQFGRDTEYCMPRRAVDGICNVRCSKSGRDVEYVGDREFRWRLYADSLRDRAFGSTAPAYITQPLFQPGSGLCVDLDW